ncbi:hypothetical protein D9O50_15245 [Oxalobacteraceae bacterium CAVE-383]|nr:hypothetical protein D9O50_15245 [Oxalobacteraceae bacterium CAVE-383]
MIHRSHPARVEGDDRDQPGNAPDRPHGGGSTPVAPTHGGGIVTGSVQRPKETHYDPAGKPIEFNSSSVRDQSAGGDFTGRESDTRDDNFIDDEAEETRVNRQLERDIGTGIDDFDADAATPQWREGKRPARK